jgi:hypothetical protein
LLAAPPAAGGALDLRAACGCVVALRRLRQTCAWRPPSDPASTARAGTRCVNRDTTRKQWGCLNKRWTAPVWFVREARGRFPRGAGCK